MVFCSEGKKPKNIPFWGIFTRIGTHFSPVWRIAEVTFARNNTHDCTHTKATYTWPECVHLVSNAANFEGLRLSFSPDSPTSQPKSNIYYISETVCNAGRWARVCPSSHFIHLHLRNIKAYHKSGQSGVYCAVLCIRCLYSICTFSARSPDYRILCILSLSGWIYNMHLLL